MQKDHSYWRIFRRFFGLDPPPPPPTIYGLFTPLDALYPARQNTYRWEDYMTNREFPRSSQCFVEKGSLHRSYSTNPHAFLRFEISAPNGPHKAIVVVGRTVKIPSPADLPSILFTSSSKFRASPQSILPAVDEITAATMGTVRGDQLMDNHNCHLVSSLTFPERAPSADELSTLLAVISKYRDTHHFSDAHFTWYTRTAFEALVELFAGSEHLEDAKCDGGKICRSKWPLCGNVHEVCRAYKEKREALLNCPERVCRLFSFHVFAY
ncbi:hypothetical protein EDD15DRAFT_2238874 [Pisolithus albus]|nr:hypothetical protein EDD15DRAFT_2238874 [Pisolithus albus]